MREIARACERERGNFPTPTSRGGDQSHLCCLALGVSFGFAVAASSPPFKTTYRYSLCRVNIVPFRQHSHKPITVGTFPVARKSFSHSETNLD